MFITTDEVERLTGYVVTTEVIYQAQAIVESYVGKLEIEVVDSYDNMLLKRATGYQAAYMAKDPVRIFEQMSVVQVSQFGASLSFKQGDNHSPWVSPFAALACNKLSWKRMRSVKFGSIYDRPSRDPRWAVN